MLRSLLGKEHLLTMDTFSIPRVECTIQFSTYWSKMRSQWVKWFAGFFVSFGVSLVAQTKESACNAGDPGLIPGLGRSPGEGNGTPLQYSCLEKPYGQRSIASNSSWDHKGLDMTERLTPVSFRKCSSCCHLPHKCLYVSLQTCLEFLWCSCLLFFFIFQIYL